MNDTALHCEVAQLYTSDVTFEGWLLSELEERGWSAAELARRAGIGLSSISMVINGHRGPGPDFCRAVARALNIGPVEVFVLAGLLPPEPDVAATVMRRAMFYFGKLFDEEQEIVIAQMRALVERHENE